MPLLLNNQELESVFDMPACIEALYSGLKALSRRDAVRRPRIDLLVPTSRAGEFGCFSSMEGVIRGGYYALRLKPDIISWPVVDGVRRRETYCIEPGVYGGLILVFRAENAELVAIMNDGFIQHMRVGGTAALGAKYLARADAETVGILGSGGMARSYAMGFAAVRKIKRLKAYSPNREHLEKYCREMAEKLRLEVEPVKTAREAVQGAEIVAACTNSLEPVLNGSWLEEGAYVANVTSRELDQESLKRITLVGYLVFEKDPLALSEFTDFGFEIKTNVMAYVGGSADEREKIPGGKEGGLHFPNARKAPCVEWDTDHPLGRKNDQEIAFLAELAGSNTSGLASSGIQGLQFAAAAGRAYELAAQKSLGIRLDRKLFLQDIPT